MSLIPQKEPSFPALLGGAVLAAGLAVVVFQTVPWESGGTSSQAGTHEGGRKGQRSPEGFVNLDWDDKEDGTTATAPTEGAEADTLLPKGISEIEGQGGTGVQRAVLKDGIWIPVFAPGAALVGGGAIPEAPLTEVPLSITSGSPAPGKTGVPFVFDVEAIGGEPPYQWRFQLAESHSGFSMDPASGVLTGISDKPVDTVLDVFVSDAAGAQDSARYPLVIEEPKPLEITTASLPTATAGSIYIARLSASGGTSPYFWSVTGLQAAGLTLTANTGELSGAWESVGEYTLEVTVSDQTEASDTKTFTLVVGLQTDEEEEAEEEEEEPGLRISSTTLPEAVVGEPYTAQLTGAGGVPPYTWAQGNALPEGLLLDATGLISGVPLRGGEFPVQILITDSVGAQATQTLLLRISNGLEITTTSPLLPGSPGLPYQLTFSATGGQAPYVWRLVEGALPTNAAGLPWTLSPDGVLTGITAPAEGAFRFTLEVQDAAERTFVRTFDLAMRQALLAVPSREKAGLAWRNDQIDTALRSSGSGLAGVTLVRGNGGYPPSPTAGVLVYRGVGNNTVDRGLPVGGTFFYSLFAHTTNGATVPYATTAVTIRPLTLLRSQPGVTGDPYADRVIEFQPLRANGHGAAGVPANITGPPDGRSTYVPASLPSEVASLHARVGAGGGVVLEFTNNIVELGPGKDFTVFENVLFEGGDPNRRFMEPGIVWVALFEGEWFRFPIDVVPTTTEPQNLMDPTYYNRGFAGRNPTTGADPTNPTASGGDAFDADELAIPGLTWIRYIRIQSTGDGAWVDDFGGETVRHTEGPGNTALSGGGSSGFDLDAVSAVNY